MKWIKENWFVVCTCFVIYLAFFLPSNSQAYGECSDYGIWATYDYLSGNCKCMSGYVFGKDIFGETTCVYGNTVCHDKYGYNSRYNSKVIPVSVRTAISSVKILSVEHS